jgi:hypothetical protein
MSVSPNTVPGDQYLGGLFMFLYRAIREHLFLTGLLPLVAMAVAYIAALQLPSVYTAQGSIRMGRVDGAEATSLLGAVSRINSFPFRQRVIQAMKVAAVDGNRPGDLIFGSLTARQETTDTLAVSVRAATPDQARAAVAAAVDLLNEEQRKTLEPLEAHIKEQLATNDKIVAGLLESGESLSALAKEDLKGTLGDPVAGVMRKIWLADLVSRNEQRLVAARAERHALSARLGAWRTYPTILLDSVFVSRGFAFAKPVTIAIFAGGTVFLTFLLGVLLYRSITVRPD